MASNASLAPPKRIISLPMTRLGAEIRRCRWKTARLRDLFRNEPGWLEANRSCDTERWSK